MIPRLHVSFRFISVFGFTLSLSRWTIFGMLIHCSCFPTHSMCLFTHIKCLTCKVKFWSIRLKSIVRPFIEWLSQPVCVPVPMCVCVWVWVFIYYGITFMSIGGPIQFTSISHLIATHHISSQLIAAPTITNWEKANRLLTGPVVMLSIWLMLLTPFSTVQNRLLNETNAMDVL